MVRHGEQKILVELEGGGELERELQARPASQPASFTNAWELESEPRLNGCSAGGVLCSQAAVALATALALGTRECGPMNGARRWNGRAVEW